MAVSEKKIYTFGEFRLDPAENLLLKDNKPLSLKPKEFSTLVCLVQNHGSLVEKSALLDNIWRDSFVEEGVVSKCVWSIRHVLGDDSRNQAIIQTVPKKGYRFVADVTEIDSGNGPNPRTVQLNGPLPETKAEMYVSKAASATDAATAGDLHLISPKNTGELSGPTSLNARRDGFLYVLFGGLGVLLLFAFLSITMKESASADGSVKMAVLPLRAMNPDEKIPAIEYVVTESLIQKLSETKNIKVSGLYSVRKYTDFAEGPLVAGQELEVGHVLDSTYQIADGKIRVTSQLLNVKKGNVEGVFRTEADVGSLFVMQDAVSNNIGNAVLAQFGRSATNFASVKGTSNEESYKLYHEAMYLIDKQTKESGLKAVELLDRAIALDPNHAQAWAVKAHALCLAASLGSGEPSVIYKIAEPALERAFLLNDKLSIAYTIRGAINRDYHLNFPEAYKDLNKATELDPNSVLAHRVLAELYYIDGKFDQAVEEQKKAIDLGPASPTERWFMGEFLYGAGRYDEAITYYERSAMMEPSRSIDHRSLWRAYHVKGNHEKAFAHFIRFQALTGHAQVEIDKYNDLYARKGWLAVLDHELNIMAAQDIKGRYSGHEYELAGIAAALDKKDTAFAYLDESLIYRVKGFSHFRVDPFLAKLRDDPRYDDLVKRAGF